MRRISLAVMLSASLLSAAEGADIQRGRQLYGIHCAQCHGSGGAPQMPGAPDLRRPPALLKPDAQLLRSLQSGRGAMPGYTGILTDRELADVIAFLRTLG
jgi:mono/diheme cytochrome c family protein